MKLRQVKIENYRSIVDSGVVDIDERVTVIVGKNEQGKTNFLKALASFTPNRTYSPSDLPTHLRATLEDKNPAEIPIVTVWLGLEVLDKVKFEAVISDLKDIEIIKITRYFDGHYTYAGVKSDKNSIPITFASPDISPIVTEIKEQVETFKNKIAAHAQRLPAFNASKPQADSHIDTFATANFTDFAQIDNLIKTFTTALKGLPGQDQAIQGDIADLTKYLQGKHKIIQQKLETNSEHVFQSALPQLLFHSTTLDRIPNEVNVQDFIKDPVTTSKGMANLCGAAGLSIQKIQELANTKDASKVRSYEDHFQKWISGQINEFWTQETYNIHFDIRQDRLAVVISDGTYTNRIQPSERSDGFQWYLSFYSALQNEVSGTDSTILLLDNPGLELHADGQKDIKRFLEEKMPSVTQTIYVTHSPAMIDPYNLEQVREVELLKNAQGTKISKLRIKDSNDFDLLEPVRSAIGTSLVSSLMFNQFNVLVEGAADRPIIEAAFQLFLLEDYKKILVNGSIAEAGGNVLPLFYQRANLPYVIFLDADERGRRLASSLRESGVQEDKIISLSSIPGVSQQGKDFDLEDILSTAFYHRAVLETYLDKSVDPPSHSNGKRTKYYEGQYKTTHNLGFSKRRVAETVKHLLLDGKGDAETHDSLKRVSETLWNALKSQTTHKDKRS